ncbi:MAG TPA: hypothetical protein PLU35_10570 [Phycisphaerales bacterium]|nr:hypothetical protein [Phycisphaerales bacterium]
MSSFHRGGRPRASVPSVHPRRVRGGLRPVSRDPAHPPGWLGRAWIALMLAAATDDARAEGLDYAKRGQTRKIDTEGGIVRGLVQGRSDSAYSTIVAVERFTVERWETVVAALAEQAMFSAKLLAGELPESVGTTLRGAGAPLEPTGPDDVRTDCTCGTEHWCKHACCLVYLLADRLEREPTLAFALRGLPADEVMERVRQRRQTTEGGGVPMPAYAAHVPGSADAHGAPLDACIDRFWQAGAEVHELEFALEPPAVSHPLLRRLGASPFRESRFPMVGLLATCYDLIGTEARGERAETDPEPHAEDGAQEG